MNVNIITGRCRANQWLWKAVRVRIGVEIRLAGTRWMIAGGPENEAVPGLGGIADDTRRLRKRMQRLQGT